MLLLHARLLSTYELPVREGHPVAVGMVQLFDQAQNATLRLPASPEAYAKLSDLEAFSDVVVELTVKEVDLGRSGSQRGRAHRLRVARLRKVMAPAPGQSEG